MDGLWISIGNIVSDTLTFMDDMGLSMAASDNPRNYTTEICHLAKNKNRILRGQLHCAIHGCSCAVNCQ